MSGNFGIRALGVGAGVGVLVSVIVGGGFGFLNNPLGNNLEVYPVKLTTASDEVLEVDVDENNKKCTNGNHPGCLLFKQDKIGTINFYVQGSKRKTKKCTDAEDNKKVITKIELTTTGAGDKGVFKSDDGAVVLEPWLKENAFPSVDLSSGIAYRANPLEQARTRVFLTNMNDHDAEDGIKTFWYQVTVSDCAGANEWVSDPRGDNKGTGYD